MHQHQQTMIDKGIKIFFVEDDTNLGFVTKDYLESEGFDVQHIADGKEAYDAVEEADFNLAVLDIMLPGVDGYDIARKIQKVKPGTPIIFLTAKSMPGDRVEGLRMGADDYITKPFHTEELKLRIDSVMKHYLLNIDNKARNKIYVRIGKYRFYPEMSLLKIADDEIELTSRESDLLNLLYENRSGLVTRDMAFRKIWGIPDDPGSRNLDVYIGKLRKILSRDPRIFIRSVHGKGYKLEVRS